MSLTKDDFKVGQEVACKYSGNMARRRDGYTAGTVTKAGHKLITVKISDDESVQFKLEPEYERGYLLQKSNYAGDYELFPSVQAYLDFEEKDEKASKIGLVFSSYGNVKLSVDQVRRIYDIVTE